MCVCAPACENSLNLIYGPRGHLSTESKPLTGASPDGGLTRLLLYIAALMGTSQENLALLICASLLGFQHFAHGLFLWEAADVLMLRRINQSSQPPHLPPARTRIPRRTTPGGLLLSVSRQRHPGPSRMREKAAGCSAPACSCRFQLRR